MTWDHIGGTQPLRAACRRSCGVSAVRRGCRSCRGGGEISCGPSSGRCPASRRRSSWRPFRPACSAPSRRPASAATLKLLCPGEGGSTYRFQDVETQEETRIQDPQLKALAEQACETSLGAAGESGPVAITNKRTTPIFVGFTTMDHKPGPITWGAGCTKSGKGARIAAGATCKATVASTAAPSRFCADAKAVPADCFDAQQNHQTMVETNFEPSTNAGCFNKGNCVWFDISVIPQNCTDALWKKNKCASTGGASYNFPVSIACGTKAKATYTCQGPTTTKWGNSK